MQKQQSPDDPRPGFVVSSDRHRFALFADDFVRLPPIILIDWSS
jgi:hypothetical protein